MHIRSATAADVPAVLPMVGALCDLHARADPDRFQVRPDVLQRYADWLPVRATDPRSVFLVAEDQHAALVAFLVGTIEPEVPIFWIPECGWIHDVWVEPRARRMGLARQLADHAAERFRALDVGQVRLHTGSFNATARQAFEAAGFRACVVELIKPLKVPPRSA